MTLLRLKQTSSIPMRSPQAPRRRGRNPRNPKQANEVGGFSPTASDGRLALPVADDLKPGFSLANLCRCPGCGGMVYLWPCLACGLEKRV
jgi:hypothetical protein